MMLPLHINWELVASGAAGIGIGLLIIVLGYLLYPRWFL